MPLIVQKFGGTSIADVKKIKKVAQRVINTKLAGNSVLVVVSAMGQETDRLLTLAQQISHMPNERELDMLLSTGEQVSIALLTMAIQSMGHNAKSFTGHQVRIVTDSSYTKARILRVDAERIQQELEKGQIVIVAGFQGMDENHEITTLGRGGSDTTALALATALGAQICEIYTDVEGVYTTDPAIVPEARKINHISYDEMLELSSLGAKVLQIRSVEFAKKYGITIHVRSSFSEQNGTWVVKEEPSMEEVVVRGVAYNKDEAKLTVKGVPDRPGLAAMIFCEVAKHDIVVDMIIQNVGEDGLADITFTVSKTDSQKAMDILNRLAGEHKFGPVACDPKITKLSVVGVGMRSHSGVAAKMFQSLANERINIMMISTSEIAISCVIESKYTELGVRTLHEAFGLSQPK
jgi:aspartate kinase